MSPLYGYCDSNYANQAPLQKFQSYAKLAPLQQCQNLSAAVSKLCKTGFSAAVSEPQAPLHIIGGIIRLAAQSRSYHINPSCGEDYDAKPLPKIENVNNCFVYFSKYMPKSSSSISVYKL
jgi:hypothetical protein